MLVGAAIARRAPSARVGACWLRRALPKPGHFRALATIPSAPVQKREEQKRVGKGTGVYMRLHERCGVLVWPSLLLLLLSRLGLRLGLGHGLRLWLSRGTGHVDAELGVHEELRAGGAEAQHVGEPDDRVVQHQETECRPCAAVGERCSRRRTVSILRKARLD